MGSGCIHNKHSLRLLHLVVANLFINTALMFARFSYVCLEIVDFFANKTNISVKAVCLQSHMLASAILLMPH